MNYFAYGSNMNVSQMLRRCPGAKFMEVAAIAKYEVAFGGHSDSRNGTVMTIVPSKGHIVEGILWKITKSDLELLDRYEGYPYKYLRKSINVYIKGGQVECICYLLKSKKFGKPSREYFNLILGEYKKHGFETRDLMRWKP